MDNLASAPQGNSSPEEIVIIGGGLAGALTALFAAQIKNADGRNKYHITLLEKNKHLFDGSSLVAARLHLGGEYPLDQQTGDDCLKGAMIWKMVMPSHNVFFTQMPPMQFAVSPETQAVGQLVEKLKQEPLKSTTGKNYRIDIDGYLEQAKNDGKEWERLNQFFSGEFEYDGKTTTLMTDNDGKVLPHLTVEKYIDHYTQLQTRYEVLLKQIGDPEEIAEKFFGEPQQFFSILQPKNAATPIAGGVQTKEPGLAIGAYLSFLQKALESSDAITVQTGVEADHITKENNQHVIHCANGVNFRVDQVVLAGWDGNPALGALQKDNEVHAYNRAMLVVNTHDIQNKHNLPSIFKPIFKMLGSDGGMFSPFSEERALVYIPHVDAGYHGGDKELTVDNPHIPNDWPRDDIAKNAPIEERTARSVWKKKYFERAKQCFPFLDGAKPLGLIIRNILTFKPGLEQRRHENAYEKEPGKIVIYPNKLTLAPQSAIEAVEILNLRSQQKTNPELVVLPADAAFTAATQHKYSLDKNIDKRELDELITASIQFAHDRELNWGIFLPNRTPALKNPDTAVRPDSVSANLTKTMSEERTPE